MDTHLILLRFGTRSVIWMVMKRDWLKFVKMIKGFTPSKVFWLVYAGHAVSMINADQYRSMPDQICGIDTNADQ